MNFTSSIQLYCTLLKKTSDIPVPSRDVTYQTLSGRESFKYYRPGIVWYVTSRLGTGMSLTFFLQCTRALSITDEKNNARKRVKNLK
jgi:hypothetical protein